jgi:hypothetical protein
MPGRAARALVPALVVVALVAVVAVASSGSTPLGTNESRRPSDQLLDSFFSLMTFLLAVAAVFVLYTLTQRKAIAREASKYRQQRMSLVALSVFLAIFTTISYFRMRDWERPDLRVDLGQLGGSEDVPTQDEIFQPGTETYDPEFVWLPVLVVVVLGAIGFGAMYLSARSARERRSPEERLAEALAAVLDDTLDDLRAEKDPRRAVIAAYARLERTLAANGLARHPSEAPGEYLARILPKLELERGSVRRLTDLFTRAKFSPHDVDAGMKEEAIDALSTVRDELRAAAERRREEQLAALETSAERT